MKIKIPFRIHPMLATLSPKPFHRPGWIYEEKYDGVRLIAYKEGAGVRLLTRNDVDRTENFPDVAARVRHLRPARLLLDGEIVVFDASGVSRFQLLQQRAGKPVYTVFDCLYHDKADLRREPLSARRARLLRVIASNEVMKPSQVLSENGFDAFAAAKRRGYEGVVAKNLFSAYSAGRSADWVKFKVRREDEFVIAGYTLPGGARPYFGALLLGAYRGSKLRYAGKVGAGFNIKLLAALHRKFQPLITRKSPFADPPDDRGVIFLAPQLMAQIAYQEWTAEGRLRQPVFLGLREDKRPEDVSFPTVSRNG